MAAAMRLLLATRQDIKILCVGYVVHPPHMEQLTYYLQREGLAAHILMPGYFSNVADPLRISDAFLQPSFIEGWSIAMNEAMFYGKPMILSDTGGAAEVIEDEDVGIIVPNEYGDVVNLDPIELDRLAYAPVPYRTAPLLAEAMERFADQRAHWRQAGQRGRWKIYERYDFASVVRSWEAVMLDVVARRAADA
jgi:glycosyltransferase involved in cell wall biosynthesis